MFNLHPCPHWIDFIETLNFHKIGNLGGNTLILAICFQSYPLCRLTALILIKSDTHNHILILSELPLQFTLHWFRWPITHYSFTGVMPLRLIFSLALVWSSETDLTETWQCNVHTISCLVCYVLSMLHFDHVMGVQPVSAPCCGPVYPGNYAEHGSGVARCGAEIKYPHNILTFPLKCVHCICLVIIISQALWCISYGANILKWRPHGKI